MARIRYICIAPVALLFVIGNGIALLPLGVVTQFMPNVVQVPGLKANVVQRDGRLCISLTDHGHGLKQSLADPPEFPIPFIERWLDARRINTVIETARVSVRIIESDEQREVFAGDWDAIDLWNPEQSAIFRFSVPEALQLPPGNYRMHAVVYANAPWGMGEDHPAEEFCIPQRHPATTRPRPPGKNVLLLPTRTNVVEIEVR